MCFIIKRSVIVVKTLFYMMMMRTIRVCFINTREMPIALILCLLANPIEKYIIRMFRKF